ncbi:MAG TPA: alkyl sulfatase dimerization domain-containing protein [Candidatus Binatia bacterium]|jgi:alkyl sulfatase BDS1-like metallo-beta-lactamase superfamily hydrolase
MPSFSLHARAPLALVLLIGCGHGAPTAPPAASAQGFADQLAEFPRKVIEAAPGVHVAVGYGLANSVLITGEGANVIVDTMESAEAAAPVRDEFRKISTAPVAAIVYTHNHADHIFGAGVMAGSDHPEVIAHASFAPELRRIITATREITYKRAMRQFGTLLADADRIHCGVGPKLVSDATTTLSFLPPTKTFDGESLDLTIAGIHMLLLHVPGETPDHIAVWLPEKRVLLCGDDYYHSFPNLYAIRGTPYRDVLGWVASIDRMRALRPAVLVPGHTLPVSGEAEIQARLGDYRDAIQFVHDQTLHAMNDGQTADDIASTLRLPSSLAAKPWLAERYGRVDWSVRAIFDGYLGWFSGDAADLSPLTRRERADRMAAMAGGSDKLRDQASAALERGDARWALELSGDLAALGEFTTVARSIRAAALRLLAQSEPSANGRNYELTEALEAEEKVTVEAPDPSRTPESLIAAIPVGDFLRAMTVRLDAAKAEGKSYSVGLVFPDIGEKWGMRVHNSVAELVAQVPDDATMTVTCDSKVWKEILTRRRNATAAFASGAVSVDRNRLELVRFLFLFR